MKFSITYKTVGVFAFTVVFPFLLASCRTIPSDPDQLTCDDLNYLASESVKKNKYPFFVSQLTHPGDWRVYSFTDSQVDWIKNDSRRRMRIGKNDWVESEALRLDTATGTQTHMKVRVLFEKCRNPSNNHSVQLTFITQHNQEKQQKTTQTADLNGNTANDVLAQLVCGHKDYPEKNKYEVMAQKWKECQMPTSQNK